MTYPQEPGWLEEMHAELAHEEPPTASDLIGTLTPEVLAWDPVLGHRYGQIRRTLDYLAARQEQDPHQLVGRAAVILLAAPAAPEAEQTLGVRLADPEALGADPEAPGIKVKCRRCKRRYVYQPESPYYADGLLAPADDDPFARPPTTAANGLCFGCVLAESRIDDQTAAIEGVVIEAPPEQPALPAGASASNGDSETPPKPAARPARRGGRTATKPKGDLP